MGERGISDGAHEAGAAGAVDEFKLALSKLSAEARREREVGGRRGLAGAAKDTDSLHGHGLFLSVKWHSRYQIKAFGWRIAFVLLMGYVCQRVCVVIGLWVLSRGQNKTRGSLPCREFVC